MEIPRLKVGEVETAEIDLEEADRSKRRRRPRRGEKRAKIEPSRSTKDSTEPAPKSRSEKKPGKHAKTPPTTGFGDHVPAFMLRPDNES
jgi:hypothetical protein